MPDGSSIGWKPRGEAVVFDLGKRGYFFALLKGVRWTGDAGPNASFTFTPPQRLYAGSVEAMEVVTNQPYGEKVDIPATPICCW